MSLVLALDIGGTFTDLVAFDLATGEIHQAKSSTTPYDLAVGIRETLAKSGLPIAGAETFIHGSTVAINTAIERTGARTALVVTEGMRDVYKIGRGSRPEAYNIFFKRPEPYVPRHRTLEIVERLNADGDVVTVLDRANAAGVAKRLNSDDIESVAVVFLHSWANPNHEAAVGAIIAQEAPNLYRSLSHEILREYREYERMSTTVLNAYVGPRVKRYLGDLENLLGEFGFAGRLLIMQSNGGTMTPETAKRVPVDMMESGPVGGIIAAAEVSGNLGYKNVLAFDMGGTTAKVSLVAEQRTVDRARLLHRRLGERSSRHVAGRRHHRSRHRRRQHRAGSTKSARSRSVRAARAAIPDPSATAGRHRTDGHRRQRRFSAGSRQNRSSAARCRSTSRAARDAIATTIARPLGFHGRRSGARHHQDRGRGHVAGRARRVDRARLRSARFRDGRIRRRRRRCTRRRSRANCRCPTLIIPRVPGHFSAVGMLMSDMRHDYVRTYYKSLADADFTGIRRIFDGLVDEARSLVLKRGHAAGCDDVPPLARHPLRRSGIPTSTFRSTRAEIAAGDRAAHSRAFRRVSRRATTVRTSRAKPVEIVNVRAERARQTQTLRASPDCAPATARSCHRSSATSSSTTRRSRIECAIYDRADRRRGATSRARRSSKSTRRPRVLFPATGAGQFQMAK